MNERPDILILGGGVIGLTTAYFLAEAGVQVTLLDRGDLGRQASWAGAGIISPGDPDRAQAPVDLLRARSSSLYPELSRRLLEETGIDNGYRVCGGLELEVDTDTPAEWRAEGIPFIELHGGELRLQVPGLAP
jgi:glycine oxidase